MSSWWAPERASPGSRAWALMPQHHLPRRFGLPALFGRRDRDRGRCRIPEGPMNTVSRKRSPTSSELMREYRGAARAGVRRLDRTRQASAGGCRRTHAAVLQDGRAAGRRLASPHARARRHAWSPSGATIARSSSPERLVFTYKDRIAPAAGRCRDPGDGDLRGSRSTARGSPCVMTVLVGARRSVNHHRRLDRLRWSGWRPFTPRMEQAPWQVFRGSSRGCTTRCRPRREPAPCPAWWRW